MPDFRLTVRYHGLKATQYFSKFSPESITVLKKDLTILGLPQPKNQNISLLSHGTVECFWPSAGMNPVLYRNLMMKTDPTPAFHEAINGLSISSIVVKETSASRPPILNSNLVKPASLKRPYEQRASHLSDAPTGHLADMARGQQTSRNQNPSEYRPHLAHSSAVPSFSYDDFSRPNKVAKTDSQVFQLSAKSINNGHPENYFTSTKKIQVFTSATPSVYPNSSVKPPCPPARLASNSSSKMTKMDLQPRRMPSNLGYTVAEVENDRVDAFLNNLLQPTVSRREQLRETVPMIQNASPSDGSALSNRIERQPTAPVYSDKVGQVPGRKIPNSTVVPTSSTSAPSSNSLPTSANTSLSSDSLLRLLKSTTEGQRSIIPLMPSIATKGSDSSAVRPALNSAAPRLLEDVSRNIGEWFAEGHELRKHSVQEEINSDREKGLKLENVIEELNEVKKVLEEERRLRREDRELLEAEQQRREEAENALADVRRECRQPFVVPSLLDAFVELSKLTTRGLKDSGPQVEASVYPSSEDHREVADSSSAVVIGHNINASHGEAISLPGVAQRTKVKLEPLDDTVML